MKTKTLFLIVLVSVLIVSLVSAKKLPDIAENHKEMFKEMIKNYFHPTIHGWGIGYDCTGDKYITAKFHIVDVKILPKNQIKSVLKQVKNEDVEDWSVVRDRIRNSLDVNGTSIKSGRISIEDVKYLLTNIQTGDTTSADIKTIPNYATCKQNNQSYEECEDNATKIGDITITKKTGTELPKEPRVWTGTMNFKDVKYKFVALVYPRSL